jgi:uncharacterized protein (TIGR02466 family)
MQHYDYFSTRIWSDNLGNIDNKKLKEEILDFSRKQKSNVISNVGGYQGHEFYNEELFNTIKEKIPFLKKNLIEEYSLYSWVNINEYGDYNRPHAHLNPERSDQDENDVLLCGVYYVSVPEKSGGFRFYDARGPYVTQTMHHQYYLNGVNYQEIYPKEGMLIFFPPWLYHDVDVNLSNESRISISFNVLTDYKSINISE